MKKILLTLLTTLLSTLFFSCAKVPFTKNTVKQNAALVYIYTARETNSIDENSRIQTYKILLNGKYIDDSLVNDEFIKYDVKSGSIIFSALRNDIDIKKLELDAIEGKIYYLKINTYGASLGKFDFKLVNETQALKEMQETTLAGAYEKKDSIISALIPSGNTKKEEDDKTTKISKQDIQTMIDAKVTQKVSTSTTATKLENIRNAYEMQKQGLLTKEEFKTMKTEILAR